MTDTTAITAPGIYDISDEVYHADPIEGGSLSSSGAKTILKAPALFNHQQHAGQEYKDVFDFGTAAHSVVLGTGSLLAVLDFKDWRASGAVAAKKEARQAGLTPILTKDKVIVDAMAEALKGCAQAVGLLDGRKGRAEQSVFWEDCGAWFRARPDFLYNEPRDGEDYLICVDYKTTLDASDSAFEKTIINYDYHMQAAHYSAGVEAVTGLPVKFVFIAQEKTAPYLVNTFILSNSLLAMGSERMDQAITVWRECRATGVWPGYPPETKIAVASHWATQQHEDNREKWGMAS